MTIDEFRKKHKITKKTTVMNWINKGFIPGSDAENDYIPNSARRPYTLARAKKGTSLVKSILRGLDQGYGVNASIYGISEEQFQAIIQSLIDQEYVISHNEDGITYYDITISGNEKIKSFSSSDWIALVTLLVSIAPMAVSVLK